MRSTAIAALIAAAALLATVVAIGASVASGGSPAPSRASAVACTPSWRLVPFAAPRGSVLNDVAALSRNDVWAVGAQPGGPLIAHWNGRAWRTVRGAARSGYLRAVSGTASNDVWAVGSDGYVPLIEHWDGARWSSRPAPGFAVLWDVAAVSRRSVWVVGRSTNDAGVAHWNGAAWRTAGGTLGGNGVAARSDRDVWAVGWGQASHWDGRRWRETPVPAPEDAFDGATLLDVAVSPAEAWAAGYWALEYEGHLAYGVIYRWNGRRWVLVFKRRDTGIDAVDAVGTADAWAIATSPYAYHREEYGPSSVLRWNGARWNVVATGGKLGGARFEAVAAASRDDVWAVGSRSDRAAVARYSCTR